MSRVMLLEALSRLLGRLRRREAPEEAPHFAMESKSGAIRLFHARGDRVRMSQVLLDVVRHLPEPMGIIVVEYRDRPVEWVNAGVFRAPLLEALMGIRDLLGGGLLDAAVFSPERGLELILGRSGELEIRTGNWNEPLARSILTGVGLVEVPLERLGEVRRIREVEAAAGDFARIDAARESLELQHPAAEHRS